MPQVLVTGATGLLGSVLVRRLVGEGRSVRIYRRESSKLDLLRGIERGVEHSVGDLTDPLLLEDAMQGVDRVYHAAAFIGVGARGERETLMRVNVEGTANVVNAALQTNVDRLLHVSSMAAFGRTERPDGVIDESSQWQRSKANSFYAYSKYLSELEVLRGVAEGLEAVIVNPSLIFGPGRADDNTRRIVDRVRNETLPAVPAGGTNVVDVQDVADGMIRAMERGRSGERYFLGGENLSWEEIIGRLAESFDAAPPRLRLSRGPSMVLAYASEALALVTRSTPLVTRETARTSSRTYQYSNRKAREELGWNARPFEQTAQRIARELAG